LTIQIICANYSNIDTLGQTNLHPISGPALGNIYQNPLFQDIASAIGLDNCWLTSDDGLSLSLASPNINSGGMLIPFEDDILGEARVSGASIDIGAYEYLLSPTSQWLGGSNSEWNEASNWLPSRPPDSTQHVVIPGGLSHFPEIAFDIVIRSIVLDLDSQIHILENVSLTIRNLAD